MKLKDLIRILDAFPDDAWVTTSRSEDIVVASLKDRMTIFIDPSDSCPTCIFYENGYCTEHEMECFSVDGCDQYLELSED